MFGRLTLLLAAVTIPLAAQSTAVIYGSVTDPSGAALVNAEVTATNEATGIAVKVKSNESGDYTFADLTPASYKIECQQPGFQTAEQAGIVLEVNRRARIDLQMKIGEIEL